MVFFPPKPMYEFDLKSEPEVMTRRYKTRSGKIKESKVQHKTLKLGYLETAKKTRIPYLHIRTPRAICTIIFSHGNATDIGHMRDHFIRLAKELQVSILAYDYSGYGIATGLPTPAYVYCDADAVYQYFLDNDPTEHVIFYGQSLGSGPTCYLARKHKASGVVVHSGFKSALQVIDKKPRSKALWFDVFPNVDNIKHSQSPLFVIHGAEDADVPVDHGISLAEASPLTYPPWYVEGGHHNDIEARFRNQYMQQMKKFLEYIYSQTPKSGSESDKGGEGKPLL